MVERWQIFFLEENYTEQHRGLHTGSQGVTDG